MKKANIVNLATFLLAVASPALIASRSSATMWIGEPHLPKKMKSM